MYLDCQAKVIAEPFAYEEYRKMKIKSKVEEERASYVEQRVRRCI